MDWKPFDTGHTINQIGSENGIIIRDEIFSDYSRITLEKAAPTAPFALTCGIYGWMVHTRYFANQIQADIEFERMKNELARIVTLLPDTENETTNITAELERFIKLYP